MSWRGWASGGADTKTKLTPRKRYFFVIEDYIEDAKQKEKDVLDLLEAIMRPTCLIKEELRQNLFKMIQFRPEITKIRSDLNVKSAKMGLPMDPRQLVPLGVKYSKK